jgi:hypothetical protein
MQKASRETAGLFCLLRSFLRYVIPALVASIHVLTAGLKQGVDGRNKSGHDDTVEVRPLRQSFFLRWFGWRYRAVHPYAMTLNNQHQLGGGYDDWRSWPE